MSENNTSEVSGYLSYDSSFSDNDISLYKGAVFIENLFPEISAGKYYVKRVVGEELVVFADIFSEAKKKVSAVLICKKQSGKKYETRMFEVNPGLSRFKGSIRLDEIGSYKYTIEAWVDEYATWSDAIVSKKNNGANIDADLNDGVDILRNRILLINSEHKDIYDEDKSFLQEVIRQFNLSGNKSEKMELLLSEKVSEVMHKIPFKSCSSKYYKELKLVVEPRVAEFSSWYNMYPRSQGENGEAGTLFDCAKKVEYVSDMGFDVVCLPPVQPLGDTNRKYSGNLYSVGSKDGGFGDVARSLGGLNGLKEFVKSCYDNSVLAALELCFFCSLDHPWIKEYPDRFLYNTDGSLKIYEKGAEMHDDMVSLNFSAGRSLWQDLKEVVDFWIDIGIKLFKVTMPYDTSLDFWQWLIAEIRKKDPDVCFVADGFCKPAMLEQLARIGFSQVNSYYMWRDTKNSIIEHINYLTSRKDREGSTQISTFDTPDYLRPNISPSTSDILPWSLQKGGVESFVLRLVMAATMSSSYSIINGYELCEDNAISGKEVYEINERFQVKKHKWGEPRNIKEFIKNLNQIRKENTALHQNDNLRFYHSSNSNVIFYGKVDNEKKNFILIAVNLDPFNANGSDIWFPLSDFGIASSATYKVEELLSGESYEWKGENHFINLYPNGRQCVIYRLVF